MNLRYLQFGAVMLWGIETGFWYFAAPMGLMLEARFFINRRWALAKQDFYRMADLTTVAMALLIALLFLNRAHYHFITTLLEWLPVLFFPLVTTLAYSTTERMPLDVIFYSLRRQKQPVTQSWDMNYVFFGLCLVAAGTNTGDRHLYMLAVSGLVLGALFRLRSPRYRRNTWILIACAVFMTAWFSQQGLRAAHVALKERTQEWLANYIHSRVNPLKTSSAIGSIGRLQLSDAIVFRVAPGTRWDAPRLLQEATYDIYSDNNWMVLNPQFSTIPHADDFVWRLSPSAPGESSAHIYLEFHRDIDIVPVPADLTRISNLPATDVRQSKYGSIEGVGMARSPGYDVTWRPGATIDTPPDPTDRFVPPNYVKLLRRVAATSSLPDSRPVAKVRNIFRGFHYSLYEDIPPSQDPLAHFLLVSKAGHCEYFATATVLLLRYFGVPARYVVGYSVQEYDPTLGMYLVRARHAHAWAIAWLNHRWQVVDTTPSVWSADEAARSSFFRPVIDALDNGTFMFQLWWNKQKLSDYKVELSIAGAILFLILVWRIATSEQVVLEKTTAEEETISQGGESPFFLLETRLRESGFSRYPGEVLGAWLRRIEHTELLPLLETHNRLRFDPRGITARDRDKLAQGVSQWLQAHEEPGTAAES